ncbi:MAG: hypothetical protein B6U88_01430 [Candidatus Aenigmarchaeota archaeon ex4484_56]|nr:MAG: hypothetical protein B6U88_01430 [Candidatus Aenigmarchaeota archaeon ex4484_56]
MISAKEGNIVFLKLSKNDNINDLQSLAETYEIKAGFLEGFGKLRYIETEDGVINVDNVVLFGIISELKGKPHIEIYCYSNKKTGKIKNFVADDTTIIIRRFDEIKVYSRLNEKGELESSISKTKK